MTNSLSLFKPSFTAKTTGVRAWLAAGTLATMTTEKDPFDLEFARNLDAAMKAAGIATAAALAEMLHLSGSRVRNWCNGTSSPTSKEAVRLADALGVTLDWLYRGKGDGMPEGKRIIVVAFKEGFAPPPSSVDPAPGQASTEPGSAASARSRRPMRANG